MPGSEQPQQGEQGQGIQQTLPVPVGHPSLREFTGFAQQGTKGLRLWLILLLNLKFKLIFGGCFFCFSFQPLQRYCCGAEENKPETKEDKEDSQVPFQTISAFRGGINPCGAEEGDAGSTAECSELALSPTSLVLERSVDILRRKKPSHPFLPYSHPCQGCMSCSRSKSQKDLCVSCTPECTAWKEHLQQEQEEEDFVRSCQVWAGEKRGMNKCKS